MAYRSVTGRNCPPRSRANGSVKANVKSASTVGWSDCCDITLLLHAVRFRSCWSLAWQRSVHDRYRQEYRRYPRYPRKDGPGQGLHQLSAVLPLSVAGEWWKPDG